MNEITAIKDDAINKLYDDIKCLIDQSKNKIYKTVKTEMINLYWNIRKIIVEKQKGQNRAKYGDYLIENLSNQLTNEFGKGFSTRNLKRMRKLYLYYPKRTTLLSQLTWSDYLELIKIDDDTKRNFYMNQETILDKIC